MELRHGFRYDAMNWLATDRSLDSALVRTLVLWQPAEGDRALIDEEINRRLAQQGEAGNLSEDEFDVGATGYQFLELLKWGCDPFREEMQRAAQFIQEHESDEDRYGVYGILTFHLAHIGNQNRFVQGVGELAKMFYGNFWEGCPGTPMLQLLALWAGRDFAPVDAALDTGMRWLADKASVCGCVPGKFLWDVQECARVVAHPRSHEMLLRQVPLLLRLQHEDGGWGEHSLAVFGVLKQLDLLDKLPNLPPLPPDWEMRRSFSTPAENVNGLIWHDGLLWTSVPEDGRVLVMTPDGQIAREFIFENLRSVTTWDGKPAVVQEDPYGLREIDPATGELFRCVLEHPAYAAGLRSFATQNEDRKTCELWDASVEELADAEGAVWYHSGFSDLLLKINEHQQILAWGEVPVESVAGIACCGEHIWLVDAVSKRICEFVPVSSST